MLVQGGQLCHGHVERSHATGYNDRAAKVLGKPASLGRGGVSWVSDFTYGMSSQGDRQESRRPDEVCV